MLPILDTVLYVLFILAHLSQQQIKCFFAFLPPGLSRYTAKLPKVGSGQYTTRQGLAREISALPPFGTYIKHGNTGETMFDIPYIAISLSCLIYPIFPLYTISETWQLKIHYKWYINLNGNNISNSKGGFSAGHVCM